MRSSLDPKLDIVFKLLFGEERNRALLVSLLNAVLTPSVPIDTVTLLHPEPARESADDKGIVLDLRVALHTGEQVDIEMQSQVRPAQRDARLVARESASAARGESIHSGQRKVHRQASPRMTT